MLGKITTKLLMDKISPWPGENVTKGGGERCAGCEVDSQNGSPLLPQHHHHHHHHPPPINPHHPPPLLTRGHTSLCKLFRTCLKIAWLLLKVQILLNDRLFIHGTAYLPRDCTTKYFAKMWSVIHQEIKYTLSRAQSVAPPQVIICPLTTHLKPLCIRRRG